MRAATSERSGRRAVLAALALTALFALAIRWSWVVSPQGPNLHPRPDVVEYVAGAQAIAQQFRYYLQIGPERFPPRYAPGWSLVYAGALRAGVPPERLWRVASAADVASLVALAAVAAALVRRTLGGDGSSLARGAPALAAALCGFVLAAAAGRIRIALTGLAEPGALAVSLAALALAAVGLLGDGREGSRRVALAAAGALGLLSAAIRPYDGAAAAAAGLALVVWAARRRGAAATLRRLGWPLGGALAVVATIGVVLARSDRPAWQWTAYSVWIPPYAEVGEWLQPGYAVAGKELDEAARRALDERASRRRRPQRESAQPTDAPRRRPSGLEVATRTLAGSPFAFDRQQRLVAGLPLAALAGVGLLVRRRIGVRPEPLPGTVLGGLAFALGAWFLTHTVAYAAYAYRMPRYFYAPAALLAVAGAWGAAIAAARGGRAARAAAALLVGWTLALAAADLARAARTDPRRPLPGRRPRVEAAVERWERMPPRRRATRTLPFDPVEAQAYGLIPLDRAGTYPWGAALPSTAQTDRLRAARRERGAAAADSVDTPRSGP